MYSLNVPVPGQVSALVWELRSSLLGFERVRDELTLVAKRLEARSAGEFAAEERAIRQELTEVGPFEAAIEGLRVFEDPPGGPAPVVYLRVESPGLESLHARLVDRFGAVGTIEGEEFVPHVTIARGAKDPALVEQAIDTDVPRLEWTVDRLIFWDAKRELPTGDVSLPA